MSLAKAKTGQNHSRSPLLSHLFGRKTALSRKTGTTRAPIEWEMSAKDALRVNYAQAD
ncbi:MAG: hypothetical protein MI864_26635 [Pseudomonadales bacterium]|nr:hypothetical protein [Pseudomonadales bacterium]